MLILVDLLVEILPDRGCLMPFKKMDADQKRSIIVNTTSHVEEMILLLDELKVDDGEYLPLV